MSKKNSAKTTTKAPKTAKNKPAPQVGAPVAPALETPVEATPTKKAGKAKAAKPKKMSALDAAAQVLEAKGEPMTAPDLIEAMAAQGLWTSPGGKTPAATLYAAMLREITTKGKATAPRSLGKGKATAPRSLGKGKGM